MTPPKSLGPQPPGTASILQTAPGVGFTAFTDPGSLVEVSGGGGGQMDWRGLTGLQEGLAGLEDAGSSMRVGLSGCLSPQFLPAPK